MPWLVLALITAANVVGCVLRALLASDPSIGAVQLNIVRAVPSFEVAAIVGTLVLTRHPRHNAGRMLLAVGGTFGALMLCESYAHYSILGDHGLPLALGMAWVARWLWVFVFASIGLTVLVLPDGRAVRPRWRSVGWVVITGATLLAVSFATEPGRLDEIYPPTATNPLGVHGGLHTGLHVLGAVGAVALLVGILLCGVAIVVRWRSSDAVLRNQLTWVAAGGALAATCTVARATLGQVPSLDTVAGIAADLSYVALFAAIGIAILRRQLFDIDLVVNRAIVFGMLAVFVAAAYVVVVVGLGRLIGRSSAADPVLSLAATAVVAVGLAPVRTWAHERANRWVYGERTAPYEFLRDFGTRLGSVLSAGDLLPAIARSAAVGVGARGATVVLALPDGNQRTAVWGDGELEPGAGVEIPVRRAGLPLGRITVVPRPGFPLTATQRHMLEDLAGQAALAMTNLQLMLEVEAQLATVSAQAGELRASRQRLVRAQDDERRRLERDLHDGAQQQLVAVTLGLRVIADEAPPVLSDRVEALREQVTDTLGALRELARGVFPPVLAEAGLVAALRTRLAKAGIEIGLEVTGSADARADREVEAALYFCTLEAVQNATKHAGAGSSITVHVDAQAEALEVSVRDDGAGFDPATRSGSGLVNLADRMAAVGGHLTVESGPGSGTTVTAVAPRR